jgi:hypothetical protein
MNDESYEDEESKYGQYLFNTYMIELGQRHETKLPAAQQRNMDIFA